MTEKSIQETYAPNLKCFGCGPANEQGLHIRSFPAGEEVIADWQPEPYQEAFPGMLSGGITGTVLDCHCNWTAAYHLMKRNGLDHPKELDVFGIRAGPPPFNELHAQPIQLLGDPNLVFGREGDILGLSPVS